MTTLGSRKLYKDKKAKLDEEDSDDTDYDQDDVLLMKKEDGYYPVKGHPGMYYKASWRLCIYVLAYIRSKCL